MTTLGPVYWRVRFTESSSFPMDDTYLHNDVHDIQGHFTSFLGVVELEMFVIVGSIILRFRCSTLWLGEGFIQGSIAMHRVVQLMPTELQQSIYFPKLFQSVKVDSASAKTTSISRASMSGSMLGDIHTLHVSQCTPSGFKKIKPCNPSCGRCLAEGDLFWCYSHSLHNHWCRIV